VVWGEWAVAFGKLAAVRRGVADRIRRDAMIVRDIDPRLEGGGGARVLGRLYHQTPRVPLLTSWATNDQAERFLRESLSYGPENKLTKAFLAELLQDTGRQPAAVILWREIADGALDPHWILEDQALQQEARRQLIRAGAPWPAERPRSTERPPAGAPGWAKEETR
jgi:hypothetical protein